MKNQSRQWVRIAALLIAAALLLTACPGSDEEPDPDPEPSASIPAAEACVSEIDRDDLAPTLAALCNDEIFGEALSVLAIEPCADGSTPRIVYTGDDKRSTVFFQEMMVRFQPVDEREPNATDGHVPVLDDGLEYDGNTQVWVLDEGDHGDFASEVVADMLNVDNPEPLDLSDPSSQVQTIASARLGAVVIDVELPVITAGDVTFTTEDLVAGTLEAIAEAKIGEGIVINMSLAAYTCGEPPARMQQAMEALEDQGVRFSASAGNDELTDRAWPAAFGAAGPLEAAVWSVGSTDADETIRSCFSNHGAWVESWLPGEEIQTQLGTWSGTSFAAPQAAAILAAGGDPNTNHGVAPADPTAMFNVSLTDSNGNQVNGVTSCSPESGYLPGYWS